ncbi:ubiquitin-like protein 4A [Hippocampus comes]|uniref:ubiquitin-like protein 4A n=1 Tax=Hippocampus comes TaxID=109280 RepID=UPI00094EF572|nr:PREDICTED: ubiquitin-like protein 4A [Hippocampus comes]
MLCVIFQVTEDEKVSTVKELVSERLNIPANQQRLLYKGKALADEHKLSDYSIGPEAKLNLVIRPAGERTGASGTTATCSSNGSITQAGVWQTVSTILAKHFSPADAAKVHEQLIKVLYLLSLGHGNLTAVQSAYIYKTKRLCRMTKNRLHFCKNM